MEYLLVDDDPNVYQLIKKFLNHNEKLLYIKDLNDIHTIMENHQIDIMILDIKLEKENGLDYIRENREYFLENNTSVIFLSQDKELKSKLKAFQFSSQDFVNKPFEPLDLMARIRSRTNAVNHQREQFYYKGDLKFDLHTNQLVINSKDFDDSLIELSSTEFKLLYFLTKNEGHIFSREVLLDRVWGNSVNVVDRTVDQHISKLRKKISSQTHFIKTHFNSGYSLSKYQYKKQQAS